MEADQAAGVAHDLLSLLLELIEKPVKLAFVLSDVSVVDVELDRFDLAVLLVDPDTGHYDSSGGRFGRREHSALFIFHR